MDQIRQLLEHKLKFMAETRDDWHAHAGPEFLLDELLREKKK